MDKYDEYDSKGFEGSGPEDRRDNQSPDPFNTQFTHDDPFRKREEPLERRIIQGMEGGSASQSQVGGDHYKSMAIQPSEFIVANNLGWYEGNAIKYICRHSRKGGKKDIEKAMHYLELLLESEYGGPDGIEY